MIELGSRAGIGLKPNIRIAQQAVEPSDSLDQVNLGFFQSIGIQKGKTLCSRGADEEDSHRSGSRGRCDRPCHFLPLAYGVEGAARGSGSATSIICASSIARLSRVTCDNRSVLAARAAARSHTIFRELPQHLRVVRLGRIRLRRTERELDRTVADCASVSLNENAAQRGTSQYLPDAVHAA